MNILFKYSHTTMHVVAQRIMGGRFQLFFCATIGLIALIFDWGKDAIPPIVFIAICIIGGLLLHFFFKPLDRITINENAFIIDGYREKTTVIPLKNIELYKSSTGLVINLSTNQYLKINYGEWEMPMVKVKELTGVLDQIIEKTNPKYSTSHVFPPHNPPNPQ